MPVRPQTLAACLLLASLSTAQGQTAPRPAPATVSFRKDIAPILVRSCLGCHNTKKAANGLDISTFSKLKRGGKASGSEVLVPGDPQASFLFTTLGADATPRMPMKAAPLPDAQIKKIATWIKEGARFDGPSETATAIASLVDPLNSLPKVRPRKPVADSVASLAFSPDGSTLAAASGRSVRLFEVASGKLVANLPDHPGPLTSLRYTPDSKTLIAAGGRSGMFGSVIVWDLATKTKRFDLRGHADTILSIDLASDGKTLATASYDRSIKLWDISTGKESRTLNEHTDSVYAVAFAPDGKVLVSAGADRTVKLWRVADGYRISSSSEPTAEVYALAFSPDGRTLYAGGVDRSIRSWTIKGETAQASRSTFAHDGPIIRLATAKDGSVYSTGEDRAIRVWQGSTLQPVANWPTQTDWPLALALSPDGKRAGVGRFDGTLALLDAKTGAAVTRLGDPEKPKVTAAPAPARPPLFRLATLNPPSPRGATRGSTVRVTLSGTGIGMTHRILIPEAGLEAKIIPAAKPDPNRLELDLTIAANARPGVHRIGVQTPSGTPGYQTFLVGEYPEVAEKEPNDGADKALETPVPAQLSGTINQPGDVDAFRLKLDTNRPIVIASRARALGSGLLASLTLLDDQGRTVASALASANQPDPVLTVRPSKSGTYTLKVTDADFGGSGNHFYRIDVAGSPEVETAFPLGMALGSKQSVQLSGANLPGDVRTVEVGPFSTRGQIIPVPVASASRRALATAEGPQTVETEGNNSPATAGKLAVPGGVSGRINQPGDADFFSFPARKGQRLILEVFAQRLGSPVDSVIEVVDAKGQAVPRALLRPVEQTTVAFRDHGSLNRNIRLTTWDNLAVGDLLLVGRELIKISELPRNPDDDAIFWGLGIARTSPGDRLGLLETTPEQHQQNQPMYKVEVHPPGAKLPKGGMPVVPLPYRNDDGGPGFDKDSRVTFDPPADGTFFVRIEDVRGMGGPSHGYHLVARSPRPDFSVALTTENPNIPRGGAVVITANLTRIDGFAGAVDLEVLGLPKGIHAARTQIEPDSFTADFLLMADADAPAFSDPSWTVKATAVEPGSPSQSELLSHVIDPGGAAAGWITVTDRADLDIAAHPVPVEIRPGERVEVTLTVKRSSAFSGRVPIEVRNLPLGVRVLNIGLNGVLVTEPESARSIFLYAEPWAQPMERTIFAVGRVEASGVSSSSPPFSLIVKPPAASRPNKGE